MFYTHSNCRKLCEVAVAAGLVLTLVLSGCVPSSQTSTKALPTAIDTQPPSQTQPVVATQPPSPTLPQPAVFPLYGTWTGSAKNGSFVMQVTIILKASCQTGAMCGTFNLQNVPCSGTFTLVGLENGVYEFHAGDQQGTCGTGKDYLQLLSNGTLQYTSQGDYGETDGILVSNGAQASPSPVTQSMPVIYDDDGSPDGTTALLFMLSDPEVSVKAVNISHGEAHPQIYIQHMGRMLDNFGINNISLGAGQDGPLSGSNEFPEWLRQSANNFWGLPLPNPQKTYPVQDAAHLMVSVLNKSTEQVTIFVSGPCTDLAQALKLDPNIRKNIKAVYIMGGAIYTHGNLSDLLPNPSNTVAEWNIYADPQAAEEVFSSGLDIYLVPLDATNQVKISKTDTGQWRSGGKIANFAADVYDSLLNGSKTGTMAIWDLMTAEIMAKPDLCSFQPFHLDVVTKGGDSSGQTAVISNGNPNINVCLKPNASTIKQTLVDVFSGSQ